MTEPNARTLLWEAATVLSPLPDEELAMMTSADMFRHVKAVDGLVKDLKAFSKRMRYTATYLEETGG